VAEVGDLAEAFQRKARNHTKVMQVLATNPEIVDRTVGFHAQQAVEKWLMAALAGNDVRFKFCHDLDYLIDSLKPVAGTPPVARDEVVALTDYVAQQLDNAPPTSSALDRKATIELVDEIGIWTEAQV
jgi:HEPN domain-containing protein